MSDSRPGSPVTMTVASVIVMLALYRGTWPLIEAAFTVTTHSVTSTFGGGTLTTLTTSYKPAWTEILYCPLHALRACNGYHNPVQSYWNWWMDRINAKSP